MPGAMLRAGNLISNAYAVDTVKKIFCEKMCIQLE